MAVIEVVINYNDAGEVTREIHVISLDNSDKIRYVTQTPGLTLKAEDNFPFLDLKAGDHVPVKFTTSIQQTQGVPVYQIYFHGTVAKFACGELDNRNTFQVFPRGIGVEGGPGGPK